MKRVALWHLIITGVVLAIANGLIYQKEQLLRHGTSIFLKLAPVDPRSLMQGDYMRLRYEVAQRVPERGGQPDSGRMVIKVDPQHVATFARFHAGEMLGAEERLLVYRRSSRGEVRLGAESFFFQEGHADRYANAQYGELKVTNSGETVLVALCDEQRQRLGTALPGASPPSR